jgi:hypothetical protein
MDIHIEPGRPLDLTLILPAAADRKNNLDILTN